MMDESHRSRQRDLPHSHREMVVVRHHAPGEDLEVVSLHC
jgi:hypothetical protein